MTNPSGSPFAAPVAGERRSPALVALEVGESVLFAALLAIAGVRSGLAADWQAVGLAGGLAIVFAAGLVAHQRLGTRGRIGWIVLLLIGTLWGSAWSRDFLWLLFPLWLFTGQLLSLPVGLTLTAVSLAAAITHLSYAGESSVAATLGPIVGAVVAFGIARGVLRLEREARTQRVLLAQVLAAQAEASALSDAVASAQREAGVLAERTRLAHDIHDTLAQGFSSIVLLARAGRRERDPARLAELLDEIERSASDNLAESRRVVYALRPAGLESGLAAALRRLTAELAASTGAEVTLVAADDLPPLPTATEVALLRAAQGVVSNVRRHAAAGRVQVTLEAAGREVRLDVVDDGRGFDPAAVAPRPTLEGGYGLQALRERLASLGGGIDVESEPGGGTAVSIRLPLTEESA